MHKKSVNDFVNQYCRLRDKQYAIYEGYAKKHSLTANELFVLDVIDFAADGCTQAEICERLSTTKQSVSAVIKKFWSCGYIALEETFRADMDEAGSIQRRLAAMKAFHDAGISTTCFISPIFPGVTDIPAIVEQVRDKCNLIWLENLNLRGNYKAVILDYIAAHYPALVPLYHEIYRQGSRSYWEMLDAQIRQFAETQRLAYLRNDDTLRRPFGEPPTIVNYFYHEQIKRSATSKIVVSGRSSVYCPFFQKE